MGRLIGKRPDETANIARGVRGFLQPGEQVLAGAYVQLPGTTSAALAGGTSGAVGATVGLPPSIPDDSADSEARKLREYAGAGGIDPEVLRRAAFLSIVITSSRLLLVRRSRLQRRRHRELLAAWQLAEVERIDVPRNGSTARIHLREGTEITLELPQAHRFLPQVYRDLPAIHSRAAAAA